MEREPRCKLLVRVAGLRDGVLRARRGGRGNPGRIGYLEAISVRTGVSASAFPEGE